MDPKTVRLPRYLIGWLVLLTGGVIWILVRPNLPLFTLRGTPEPVPAAVSPSRYAPAPAEKPPVSGKSTAALAALEEAFVEIAATVSPAVVYIHSEWSENEANPLPEWPEMEEWFRRWFGPLPGQPEGQPWRPKPREQPREASGSGMIFRPDGYILTNAHVVENAKRVQVKIEPDGQSLPAKILGRDLRTDLAVLKINADKKLPVVTFGDSDKVRIGSWALAIGSPFEFESSVTAGIVSARGRELPDPRLRSFSHRNLIQTDASINPGNSGGPLVNLRGEVIGVNVAIYSPSGGNVGIGFAVPINTARQILDELIEHGQVRRGYLGVGVEKKEPEAMKALYGVAEGALVSQVEPGSPAAKAGLQPEDVIIEFNGHRVANPDDLIDAVTSTEPGKKATLKLVRNKQTQTVSVIVAELPVEYGGTAGSKPAAPSKDQDVLGLSVKELPPSLSQEMEVPEGGVLVESVTPASPAADAGFVPGMIITQIRDAQTTHAIRSLRDYQRVLAKTKKGNYLAFTVLLPGPERMSSRILHVKMP